MLYNLYILVLFKLQVPGTYKERENVQKPHPDLYKYQVPSPHSSTFVPALLACLHSSISIISQQQGDNRKTKAWRRYSIATSFISTDTSQPPGTCIYIALCIVPVVWTLEQRLWTLGRERECVRATFSNFKQHTQKRRNAECWLSSKSGHVFLIICLKTGTPLWQMKRNISTVSNSNILRKKTLPGTTFEKWRIYYKIMSTRYNLYST